MSYLAAVARSLALISALSLVFAACNGDDDASPLSAERWELITLDGERALQETTVWIAFGDDGSIEGSTGCNSFGGAYERHGDELAITDFMQTLIGCPDAIGDQEAAFTAALQASASYRVESGALTLFDGDGVERMTFARTPATDVE